MAKHFYWPTLVVLVKKLCKYYMAWRVYLPADLPPEVTNWLPGVDAACAALIQYDRSHPGGSHAV